MSLTIQGTGSALPAQTITNHMLAQIMDTSDEWITTRTGITERRILDTESLTDLSVRAAQNALDDAGIAPSALDLILCSTIRGDTITPSLACLVQGRIGASCPAFDLNAACTGFLYALDVADAYLNAGKARHILIVSAEAMSRIVDWRDRATCVLFGDGAGAAVVSRGDDLLGLRIQAQANDQWLIARSAGGSCPYSGEGDADTALHMNGQEVYKFAVSCVLDDVEWMTRQLGITPDDISLFVLHQANKRILEAVRARLKQPAGKFPSTIEKYGNTSSSSLPILLDEVSRAGKLAPGQLLFFSAFGAGLTNGACVLRWRKA
ncbi:MAG: ketoacyl-ACP synthase III [Eubacteriales bacterium]|nr:ketoacyl-ACP synthase III [Eubacteriales bacterium]